MIANAMPKMRVEGPGSRDEGRGASGERRVIECPVAELAPHPLNRLPGWAEEDPRFLALCASVQECGVQVPLICDAQRRILDGVHRWRAARRVGLETVPVEIRPEEEAAEVILHTLLARKHYSRGQLAYLALPLLEARLAGLKPHGKKAEILAQWLGVSPRLIEQARELRKIFQDSPEYKAMMEPRVLDEPDRAVGLGAAIAGYAGWKATRGVPRPAARTPAVLWWGGFERWLRMTGRVSLEETHQLIEQMDQAIEALEDTETLGRLVHLGREMDHIARKRLKALQPELYGHWKEI